MITLAEDLSSGLVGQAVDAEQLPLVVAQVGDVHQGLSRRREKLTPFFLGHSNVKVMVGFILIQLYLVF